MIADEADEARPRPEGRHRARLPGAPDAAGPGGDPAGARRRDRDDPQAHRRPRRLRARDPALRARPDLDRPARRAERRSRDRAGRHDRAAAVLRLGGERARPARAGRPVRGHQGALRRGRVPRRQKGKAEQSDIPEGSDEIAARRPTRTTTPRATSYYLFGPDRLPIGPDKASRCATADYEPSGSCSELLSRLRAGRRRRRPSTPRTRSASRSWRRSGRAARRPARGSSRCREGVVVVEARARAESQPRADQALLRASRTTRSCRARTSRTPSRTSTRTRTSPIVTMEFTDRAGRRSRA